jgi:hypothetical protein
MIVKYALKWMCKEAVVAYLKVLYQHFCFVQEMNRSTIERSQNTLTAKWIVNKSLFSGCFIPSHGNYALYCTDVTWSNEVGIYYLV